MPRDWFFEIYEDTPEEEAANLMEHSTLTLDLSSDEESSRKEKDGRGKENVAPEDYDAPTASRSVSEPSVATPRRVKKTELVRKKIVTEDMDDGERSPLSDLETDPFIPEGLDKDAHVIVDAITPEKGAADAKSAKMDVKELFATPVSFTAGSAQKRKGVFDLPVLDAEGDVKGEIIVWEDSPVSERAATPEPFAKAEVAVTGTKVGKEVEAFEVYDENAAPAVDEVA